MVDAGIERGRLSGAWTARFDWWARNERAAGRPSVSWRNRLVDHEHGLWQADSIVATDFVAYLVLLSV
jgi:hypothetical protein